MNKYLLITYSVIITYYFFQPKLEFQPQSPILHPLRNTIPQHEPNVSMHTLNIILLFLQ